MKAYSTSMQTRNWFFTDQLVNDEWIKENIDIINAYCYQMERGKETNKVHYQGVVQFKTSRRLTGMKKISEAIHWERVKDLKSAIDYCSKEDTRIGETKKYGEFIFAGHRTDIEDDLQSIKNGTFDKINSKNYLKYHSGYDKVINLCKDKIQENKFKDKYSKIELIDIQKQWLELLNEQNDRIILWIYDPDGGNGKSTFAKYMKSIYNCIILEHAKKEDIAYAYNGEDYVVFDYVRDIDPKTINYGIYESLKNGIMFSGKYESKSKYFIPPKIIVLANFYPDESKLTKDRWQIITIPSKKV